MRAARAKPVRIAVVAVLFSLALSGCRTREPVRPNVILISLDTLRADHLGAYGYDRRTSPFLDGFAAEATVFRNAISPASWTLPAHASMLLGHYPHAHGMNSPQSRIDAGATTLAEVLRDGGYATAGFFSVDLLGSRHGFDQGFQTYERVHPGEGGAVNAAALRWLALTERPFFLFLHYYDVHDPYLERRAGHPSYCHAPMPTGIPPFWRLTERSSQRFLQRLGIDEVLRGDDFSDVREFHRFVIDLLERHGEAKRTMEFKEALNLNGDTVTTEERACVVGLYDDGIGYLDERLEELFGELARKPWFEDTILIITSDHGDDLYDHHAYRGHGRYVYQSNIHVPLMVKRPGQSDGRTVNSLVTTVDLMPTILEATGVAYQGAVQGRSLVPLLEGQSQGDTVSVTSVTYADDARTALVRGRWKLIKGTSTTELFDLETDSDEQRNLAGEHPDRVRELEAELVRLATDRGSVVRSEELVPLDEASREQLRALGYLD